MDVQHSDLLPGATYFFKIGSFYGIEISITKTKSVAINYAYSGLKFLLTMK
jgi:hypothetical protein